MEMTAKSPVFEGLEGTQPVLMSHTDYLSKLRKGLSISAKPPTAPMPPWKMPKRKLYGFQFHPEVVNTKNGTKMIKFPL